MTIINMTPHDICIIQQEKTVRVIPASGVVARCDMLRQAQASLDHIPAYRVTYGAVQGLPEAKEGIFYIVSSIVALAMRGQRNDLLVPLDFVRDDAGRILGCQALAHIEP